MFTTRYATGSIWSTEEFLDFKTWLKSELVANETPVTVVFTKKDGTERKMRCTLNAKHLPKVDVIESDFKKLANKTINYNASAQRVFDLDVMQWRSFSWNSVKYVEYNDMPILEFQCHDILKRHNVTVI